MTVYDFSKLREGKSNLYQIKDLIDPSRIVTLNVVQQDGKLVMSSTVAFARVEEVENNKELMVITNTTMTYLYLSKDVMQKYILSKIFKTANGYDHQYVFTYQI